MPVVLNSQDNEAKVTFSYSFDINLFATPPMPVCGANAINCTIVTDTSVFGRVGVTLTPAGGVFSRTETAGVKEVARINFQSLPNSQPSTPINFVSTPVAGQTFDAANNPLLTTYFNGLIVFAQGLEGDVAGRNAGNGTIDSTDVVQVRRFVTGLDTPVGNFNEFQRADVAPTSTKGNGIIDATDVIQARRYAAGLDAPQSAGGPGAFIPGPIAPPASELASAGREILGGSAKGSSNSRVTLPVEMRAAGDEAALSFTVRYDATKLSNPSVELGEASDGVVLTYNANEPGVIRILIDRTAPYARTSKDPMRLINVSFDVSGKAPAGDTSVTIERGTVSDGAAMPLPTRYTPGTITISRGKSADAISVRSDVDAR